MRWSVPRLMALSFGVAVVSVAAAEAQVPPPPPSPEASEIAHCLCLHQSIGMLGAGMNASRQSFGGLQDEIGRLDAQLQRERATMDVNDPAAVGRFRQLLERRDAAFRRSTGAVGSGAATATARYNVAVDEYNARCANRPRDPRLLESVGATLVCPAVR